MVLYPGEAANQLSKYLLKTLCSDLTNIIVIYLAEDLNVVSEPADAENITPKVRWKDLLLLLFLLMLFLRRGVTLFQVSLIMLRKWFLQYTSHRVEK